MSNSNDYAELDDTIFSIVDYAFDDDFEDKLKEFED